MIAQGRTVPGTAIERVERGAEVGRWDRSSSCSGIDQNERFQTIRNRSEDHLRRKIVQSVRWLPGISGRFEEIHRKSRVGACQ